jgi:hypothetical protein
VFSLYERGDSLPSPLQTSPLLEYCRQDEVGFMDRRERMNLGLEKRTIIVIEKRRKRVLQ